MTASTVRVVHPESDELNSSKPTVPKWEIFEVPTVRVSAGETLALLLHAARTNRSWLSDFAEETFVVSQDLYEVLLAYKRIAQTENARAA